jgi:hypothetical protein
MWGIQISVLVPPASRTPAFLPPAWLSHLSQIAHLMRWPWGNNPQPKGKGENSMSGKPECEETASSQVRQDPDGKAKAELP